MTALRDVSFDLEAGEVLCIVGANGAGKTTLMRSLASAHPSVAGRILHNGRDVTAEATPARVRGGIAMSPEGRRLFADMTVRVNLLVAAENGRRGAWSLQRVRYGFPQLVPLLDRPAGRLSGGQRQAAAIGRALLANPDVLLLDEVSLGLSPAAVDGVYASLGAIRDTRGVAMVIVEQDLGRALSFADRILCMAEGVVEMDGAPAEFSRDDITAAYFGIREREAADA
jgi:branched-chain amino acid transport system ATP-binding protein